MPSLDYAPYLFTDDPYYLEELQANALYGIVIANYFLISESLPGLAAPNQTRGQAWSTRSIAQAAYVTPASVPSWLNSQAHWQTNLNDNYTFAQRFVNSPSIMSTYFHAFGRTDNTESFMMDFIGYTYAWIARLFPSWNAATYQWIMAGIIPRLLEMALVATGKRAGPPRISTAYGPIQRLRLGRTFLLGQAYFIKRARHMTVK
jgi:hypothetical protein